jgi:nucleoside-diphosphate-sugar epimerase
MRVVVIGGTGHIGTYLVPRLTAAGHEVISLSRGQRQPYQGSPAWTKVHQVEVDRSTSERDGSFGSTVRDLRPDVVVDLVCFHLESAQSLVEALRGHVRHFLHCGTLWVHGPTEIAPTPESVPRRPFGDYGVQKAAIEEYLLDEARRRAFPATVLHPGHIVGPGWPPINPAGNLDPKLFAQLAAGEEVSLPDQGLATLHHVHADDVAQAFERALNSWGTAVGESFHVASPAAITLVGYARAVAGWFGREPHIRLAPWPEWRQTVTPEQAAATWDHIAHSPCASIEKSRYLLGYAPRYSSLEALREAVAWLIACGHVNAPSLD